MQNDDEEEDTLVKNEKNEEIIPLMREKDLNISRTEPVQNDVSMRFMILFKYMDKSEKVLAAIGTVVVVLGSCGLPAFIYSFSKMHEAFTKKSSDSALVNSIGSRMVTLAFFSFGTLIFLSLCIYFWILCGERIAQSYKREYLKALMKKKANWYDKEKPQEFAPMMGVHCNRIESAAGEKIGLWLFSVSNCVVAVAFGLMMGWKLTLCEIPCFPLALLSSIFFAKSFKISEGKWSQKAGGIAEETLSAARVVHSYNAEEKEIQRYGENLEKGKAEIRRRGVLRGLGLVRN